MDYKNEIVTLLDGIQSEKFMKFLYNMIISFKKQWGSAFCRKHVLAGILKLKRWATAA